MMSLGKDKSKWIRMDKEARLKSLLLASQAGDQSSYKEFLSLIYPMIQSKVLRKVFSPDDAHDVIQEVVISIHQSLATYDSHYPVGPWLHTICQRRVIDYIRKVSKYSNLHSDEEFDVTNHIGAANIESEKEKYEILETLTEENKKIVLLTKVYGLSTTEAAQELGMKENALRTRLSRAFKDIEKALKKEI